MTGCKRLQKEHLEAGSLGAPEKILHNASGLLTSTTARPFSLRSLHTRRMKMKGNPLSSQEWMVRDHPTTGMCLVLRWEGCLSHHPLSSEDEGASSDASHCDRPLGRGVEVGGVGKAKWQRLR